MISFSIFYLLCLSLKADYFGCHGDSKSKQDEGLVYILAQHITLLKEGTVSSNLSTDDVSSYI